MNIEGMTEAEYMDIMHRAEEEMRAHHIEQTRIKDEALAYVATIVGERKLQHIKDYIVECESTFDFEIVDTHGGHRQDETGYAFRYIYLDQYSNGGMSGDDYAGYVWIPLPKGKFLKFHYAM